MSTPEEPLLRGLEIQGDSLAGFRKDFVSLLFLEFDAARIADVKRWLRTLQPATLAAVGPFNAAFSAMRRQLHADPPLHACWMNIGFTAAGLRKLIDPAEVGRLGVAFNAGAHGRSAFVGDPEDGSPGDPRTWVIGGPHNLPDAMMIVAADHETHVAAEVRSIRESLDAIAPGLSPVRVLYEQPGHTRPTLSGHEHFGFKDGVSQPGVRGRIDTPTEPLLTPRYIDPGDPLGDLFAAPGQPLLWPGEFVFGYPEMDVFDPLVPVPTTPDPAWLSDGSFLVFRRLYQDVPAFERFLQQGAAQLTADGFTDVTPGRFGALCVGRWPSGTPISRAPLADDPRFADDQTDAKNSFVFTEDTIPVQWRPSSGRQTDTLPAARRDFDGVVCPLPGHIRKMNPRDEPTEQGDFPTTFARRIIRRGIPYGEDYDPAKPGSDKEDRGLLFLSYQTSIEDQFEFLQRNWANAPDTPRNGAGIDPIIGQADAASRKSRFLDAANRRSEVTIAERFVIATGGAYLFVPSISTLRDVFAA